MDSLQDFSHSPRVKACDTTIPHRVYLYGRKYLCVFVQLGINLGATKAHCYGKTNGDRFCNVTWSNLPILGIRGLISGVRQSYQKERTGMVLSGRDSFNWEAGLPRF